MNLELFPSLIIFCHRAQSNCSTTVLRNNQNVATELTNTITDESLEKFVESSKKMETLKAEDIASAIIFAINAPNHVSVNEILVRQTTQDR